MAISKKLMLIIAPGAIALALFITSLVRDIAQRTQVLTIQSNILNEIRTVQVFLPENYETSPNKTYDVLYTLDGERIRNSILQPQQ